MEENQEQPQPATTLKVRTGMLIGDATIYGSYNCSYTNKQIKAFVDANIPYDVVDCDWKPDMCKGMSAYPVVKNYPNDGDSWVGFKPL